MNARKAGAAKRASLLEGLDTAVQEQRRRQSQKAGGANALTAENLAALEELERMDSAANKADRLSLYAGKGANGRRASRRTSTRRSIANKKQTGGGATSTAPAAEDDEEARLRSYFEAQQQAPGGIVAQ